MSGHWVGQFGSGALASAMPGASFWMPPAASSSAGELDWLYLTLVWISAVAAVGVIGAMVYFVVRYRSRARADNEVAGKVSDHNTALEIVWSVVPLVVVVFIFAWGFKGYVELRSPPKDALEIQVTGQKWNWNFDYSNGLSDSVLHVPLNTPVRLVLSSVDVIHSLYIPAFRIKMDAVPGRYTQMWFNATQAGEFQIFCAEYCGTSHSDMLTKVVVHEPGGYEKWLEEQQRNNEGASPVELGAKLYEKQGCQTCHSTDGSIKVGPSFKALFAKKEVMADDSTVVVEENYLRESMMEPQAKIVKGFGPVMPTFKGKLSDRQITGLIEYIKSLK
jgi:cytochrome c oxidase subunit 2